MDTCGRRNWYSTTQLPKLSIGDDTRFVKLAHGVFACIADANKPNDKLNYYVRCKIYILKRNIRALKTSHRVWRLPFGDTKGLRNSSQQPQTSPSQEQAILSQTLLETIHRSELLDDDLILPVSTEKC